MTPIRTDKSGLDMSFDSLLSAFSANFERILTVAAGDEKSWRNRIRSFSNLALLEYLTPSRFKPAPLNADEERLHDGRYRRHLIARLKAPRPSKWARHLLVIDRDRTICDPAYRAATSHFFASKLMAHMGLSSENLSKTCSTFTYLVLLKMSAEEFAFCLDNLAPNELDAERVAAILTRRMAYALIDANPSFQALIGRMKSEFAQIREIFNTKE
jgi:hypothetical protein